MLRRRLLTVLGTPLMIVALIACAGIASATTDTEPPSVVNTTPADGETNVSLGVNVEATFSEAMTEPSIHAKTFRLFKRGDTTQIAAQVSYQAEEKQAVLIPQAGLDPGTTYKAVVRTGARDLAGNRIESRKRWFFTTEGNPELGLKEVASGLASPVHLLEAPDDRGRLFIVDQPGRIWIVNPDGTRVSTPFLDISSRMVPLNVNGDERGLLGMAFHPDYAQNGRFFVYYGAPLRPGAPAGFNHTSIISEFQVTEDPNVADPASERILLQVDQPQANHNGGMLAFGPHDGKLYIGLGDGGGRDDENPVGHVSDWYDANAGGNGQNIEANLLGKILRIDVDSGVPYGIPADNPYVGGPGLDEIWAYGFRNPFRFSFDMGGNHDLLVGDAGQERWEEVSLATKGGNYGWNVKEGTHCFDAAAVPPFADLASCPNAVTSGIRASDPLVDPVIEYANSKQAQGGLGRVVVGGYVYRGTAVPQLRGRYIFGDYTVDFAKPNGNGSVFMATRRNEGLWYMQQFEFPSRSDCRLGDFVKGFGQDAEGEIYILSSNTTSPFGTLGKVYQLVQPEEVG